MENKFEVDLKGLILFVFRKCYYIIIAAVVMAVIGFSYAKTLTPRYSASALLYVNNFKESVQQDVSRITASDMTTSQMLVQTYLEFLKSSKVLDDVSNELNNEFASWEIRGMMSAAPLNETEVFQITITHTDKEVATRIANMIADKAPAIIQGYIKGSSVEVVDYAKEPTSKSYPSYKRYLLFGGVAGGGIAFVIIVLIFLFNSKIKGKEDLEKLFTAPIIGEIPNFEQAEVLHKDYKYSNETEKITPSGRRLENVKRAFKKETK